MLLKEEIRIDEVYVYDLEGMFGTLNPLVDTVRIVKANENNGILTVESLETAELLCVGSHMLTTMSRAKKIHSSYASGMASGVIDKDQQRVCERVFKKLSRILK